MASARSLMPSGPRTRAAMIAILAATVLGAAAPRAGAQQVGVPIAPELRLAAIGGDAPSVQGGVGVQIPAGYYVRFGVIAGAGVRTDGAAPSASGRLDVLARFLIDPFRQSPWGLSAGGGVSLRAEEGDRVRPKLLLALDLESRRRIRGASPSVQVGLGGGVRAGIGLRWTGRATR